MKKLSIYLLTLLTAFAVSCSGPEPEVAPETNNTSVDNSARKPAQKAIEAPIEGSIQDQKFSGVYRITKFIEQNGQVYAVGSLADLQGVPISVSKRLSGKEFKMQVVEANGVDLRNTQQASQAFTMQLVSAQQAPRCNILFLELGPLQLNLLGLEIDLSQVVLVIDAVAGTGILGDLLCAIANLLNFSLLGQLLQFVDFLNELIDLIGTL